MIQYAYIRYPGRVLGNGNGNGNGEWPRLSYPA